MDYYSKYLKYKAKYIALKQFAGADKGKKKSIDFDDKKNKQLVLKLIAIDLNAIPKKPKHEQNVKDWISWLAYNPSGGIPYGTSQVYLDRNPEMKEAYEKYIKDKTGGYDSSDSDSVGGSKNKCPKDFWKRLSDKQRTVIVSLTFCMLFRGIHLNEVVLNISKQEWRILKRYLDCFNDLLTEAERHIEQEFLKRWERWVSDKTCKNVGHIARNVYFPPL
jgi:hypothetical protein